MGPKAHISKHPIGAQPQCSSKYILQKELESKGFANTSLL